METQAKQQEVKKGGIDYFNIPEIKVTYKDKVKVSERVQVRCSLDVIDLLRPVFDDCMQHHEEVWILYLNRANRVLGIYNLSKGGINETVVDIKIILQIALKTNSSGIIFCHNHPSGNCKPSDNDVKITERLRKSCKMLDLILLDSVIITEDNYFSSVDEGIL